MARYHCDMFEFAYVASLHILHPTIDPKEITAAIGITPERSHRVGEEKKSPKGTPRDVTYPSSYWRGSLGTTDGEDLVQFLRNLVGQLSPHRQFLKKLMAEDGSIECFLGLGVPRNCDQLIPSDLLSELGQMGIDLRLDIYGSELPQKNLGL